MTTFDITTDTKPGAFERAISELERGTAVLYARGPTCCGPHRHAAIRAYNEGKVTLVQRRIRPSTSNRAGMFDYLAQIL